MSKNLRLIIKDLMATPLIKKNTHFNNTLANIDKYSSDDYEIAYLLGYFFKYQTDSDNLPGEQKEKLIREIKAKNLTQHYYLKKKPNIRDWMFFQIMFLIIGIAAIVTGIVFTLTNSYTFHFNPSKLSVIFVSGGYYLLFGILMVSSSIIGIIRNNSKRKFLKAFIDL